MKLQLQRTYMAAAVPGESKEECHYVFKEESPGKRHLIFCADPREPWAWLIKHSDFSPKTRNRLIEAFIDGVMSQKGNYDADKVVTELEIH